MGKGEEDMEKDAVGFQIREAAEGETMRITRLANGQLKVIVSREFKEAAGLFWDVLEAEADGRGHVLGIKEAT